jgi:EAL domain-containing protein (putative c-di-GMP-specific phosphodiesterase class I)
MRAAGDYRFSFRHDGIAREYLVHVPRSYHGAPTAMLIALHGGGGDADFQADDGKYKLITASEERGFIVVIGDWVLRTACKQARQFRDRFQHDLRVSVNISARQFREQTLVTSIEDALRDSGLEPHCLELEITESVAMENVDLTIAVLARLRHIGITIAIDDFGTGHSSLSYLKRFPIDALKIDRSFVEDLPDRYEDVAIVDAVIQLARGLNLRVVAEGVETRQQLEFLKAHRCREVQGHCFSYPLPAAMFEQLFEKQQVM